MKNLYRLLLPILEILVFTPFVYSQNLSAMDKFCYPQMNKTLSLTFSLLKKANVEYLESIVVINEGNESTRIHFSVWPTDEISVMHLHSVGLRDFETIVLCGPKGYFFDRSDLPRVAGKKMGDDILARVRGNLELLYPSELKYLTGIGLIDEMEKIVSIFIIDEKKDELETFLKNEKMKEFRQFILEAGGDRNDENFSVDEIKFSLRRNGMLIDRLSIKYPGCVIEVENKFVYSENDENYKKFEEDKYYHDFPSLNELKSFGIQFFAVDNKIYAKFSEKWSNFLYDTPRINKLIKNSVSSINETNLDSKKLETANNIISCETAKIKIIFENGEEFTFIKLPFEVYDSLDVLSEHIKNDIFWINNEKVIHE